MVAWRLKHRYQPNFSEPQAIAGLMLGIKVIAVNQRT
jgi:hypothetical protein